MKYPHGTTMAEVLAADIRKRFYEDLKKAQESDKEAYVLFSKKLAELSDVMAAREILLKGWI